MWYEYMVLHLTASQDSKTFYISILIVSITINLLVFIHLFYLLLQLLYLLVITSVNTFSFIQLVRTALKTTNK